MKNKTFFAFFISIIMGLCCGMEHPAVATISSFKPVLEYVKAARKSGGIILFDYDDTIHTGKGILTDSKLPEIINEFITWGYQIGILTARRPSDVHLIKERLGVHNITINLCEGHEFKLGDYSSFAHGVITAGNDAKGSKSQALSIFLEHAKIKPSEVIFIDDKQRHVLDIQTMCSCYNYSFKGFVFRKR